MCITASVLEKQRTTSNDPDVDKVVWVRNSLPENVTYNPESYNRPSEVSIV
jgi:hypothetical protein